MDSLFDADLFSVGEPATELVDELAPPVVAAPEVIDARDVEAALAEPDMREGVSAVVDPGDVLNDPAWEPATDVPDDQRARSADVLWTRVVSQDAAVATLRCSTAQPVHAYLFLGPAGVGAGAAANAFAAALLCPRGGCGHCDVCVRALAGLHPDVIAVEREGASISVDQAREIIRLAMRSPVEGERKVLVLHDFHLVTSAGPTLLKIIEEPPASTVFVILADHVTNELVTIASRCVKVEFRPLSLAAISAALCAEGVDEEAAGRAASSADGSLDRARLLATDPLVETRRSFWSQIPFRLDGSGAVVAVIAAEAVALLDSAAVGPLEQRHAAEVAVLQSRLEAYGARGSAGLQKELVERHRRELKRLRDDELRFGLAVLQRMYRDAAVSPGNVDVAPAMHAVRVINDRAVELVRNPNLGLFLQALLLSLPELKVRAHPATALP